MSLAAEMLRHTPVAIGFDKDQLTACIEACFECAQVCTACADACLGEDAVVEWRHCITINLNCADVCSATGRILSRQVGYDVVLTRSALEACRDVCRRCAEECERHADMHEHCRICAEACRRCERACDLLLAA